MYVQRELLVQNKILCNINLGEQLGTLLLSQEEFEKIDFVLDIDLYNSIYTGETLGYLPIDALEKETLDMLLYCAKSSSMDLSILKVTLVEEIPSSELYERIMLTNMTLFREKFYEEDDIIGS